jgi:hypothetical protein
MASKLATVAMPRSIFQERSATNLLPHLSMEVNSIKSFQYDCSFVVLSKIVDQMTPLCYCLTAHDDAIRGERKLLYSLVNISQECLLSSMKPTQTRWNHGFPSRQYNPSRCSAISDKSARGLSTLSLMELAMLHTCSRHGVGPEVTNVYQCFSISSRSPSKPHHGTLRIPVHISHHPNLVVPLPSGLLINAARINPQKSRAHPMAQVM